MVAFRILVHLATKVFTSKRTVHSIRERHLFHLVHYTFLISFGEYSSLDHKGYLLQFGSLETEKNIFLYGSLALEGYLLHPPWFTRFSKVF